MNMVDHLYGSSLVSKNLATVRGVVILVVLPILIHVEIRSVILHLSMNNA